MSKYHSRKTEIDGIKFHSIKEAKRYVQLKHLESVGLIFDLELQPPFKYMSDNGKKKLFTYKADFKYTDEFNQIVIEDVKGYRTEVYKLKKKLIEDRYGITIYET